MRDELAGAGFVVIGPEFRNAGGALGPHPFPGLDDCAAALDWMHANRAALGIDKIIMSGDSGGANLSIATSLKAKRESRLDAIDGVFPSRPTSRGSTAGQKRSAARRYLR